ncbi:hypothetical protein C6P97_11875 [Burkholderia multivorans]|uniref:Uncharacterized protein n=1 Tax=Burkholderia multivorans TaxID=87883 RepID=A0AB37AYE9_9BURK|nr:hypothetical protein C6P97_11875 [Burkholderia multivorans]PRE50898.1 hypothetical protein C6P99_11670 [Burkholderia multivorans]
MRSRRASIASRRIARSVGVGGVPSRAATPHRALGASRAVPYNAHKNAAKSIASGTAESRTTPIRQRPGD